MSTTPRTDAVARPLHDQGQDGDDVPWIVPVETARQLENELASAKQEIDRLNAGAMEQQKRIEQLEDQHADQSIHTPYPFALGILSEAGTIRFEGFEATGLFIKIPEERLKEVKHLPMYHRVGIVDFERHKKDEVPA